MHKHNKSRLLDNGLFSKLNINNRTETERRFSIHSNADEVVYHDIVDMKDQFLNTNTQHGVSNVSCHYHDSSEQRYSDSPKSSTSTYENECNVSHWSMKTAVKPPKEHISRYEPAHTYHKLSNDNRIALTSTQDEGLFQTETVDIEDTMTKKTSSSSFQTKHNEQCAAYEEHVSLSNAKESLDDGSDFRSASAFYSQDEDLTSPVYHVLQKKAEKHLKI